MGALRFPPANCLRSLRDLESGGGGLVEAEFRQALVEGELPFAHGPAVGEMGANLGRSAHCGWSPKAAPALSRMAGLCPGRSYVAFTARWSAKGMRHQARRSGRRKTAIMDWESGPEGGVQRGLRTAATPPSPFGRALQLPGTIEARARGTGPGINDGEAARHGGIGGNRGPGQQIG